MGVKCNITSAYHHQSNGLDERFNQALQRQLLKYVNEEQNEWDLYLDAFSSLTESRGKTPQRRLRSYWFMVDNHDFLLNSA